MRLRPIDRSKLLRAIYGLFPQQLNALKKDLSCFLQEHATEVQRLICLASRLCCSEITHRGCGWICSSTVLATPFCSSTRNRQSGQVTTFAKYRFSSFSDYWRRQVLCPEPTRDKTADYPDYPKNEGRPARSTRTLTRKAPATPNRQHPYAPNGTPAHIHVSTTAQVKERP